jgi:tetratricopeptide (TPR) repeat protein
VQLVWVNTEGLFVLGYVLLAAALVDRRRDVRLWRASGLAAVAALLNPYFVEGALHPLVLKSRIDGSMEIYSATIGEFLSPFQPGIGHPAVALFPYFLGALGLALGLSRRPRLSEILLLVAFGTLAFQARRNLALLAIVAAPILARWLAAIPARPEMRGAWERLPRSARAVLPRASRIVAAAAFLVHAGGLVTHRSYARIETNREFGAGIAEQAAPVAAAAFLHENDLPGPVFSTLSAGSYLIWADPARPVFVDGRLEVHSAEHYARYLAILGGGEAWAAADREFRFGAILLAHAEAPALARERLADPAWAAVWLDPEAVVLVRRSPENEALIARAGYDRERLLREHPPWESTSPLLPPEPSTLRRHLGRVHVPWAHITMGQLLSQLGATASAAAELREAVFAEPVLASPRILYASSLNQMGRSEEALTVIASAAGRLRAGDDELRLLATRGDILLSSGRPAEAEESYGRYLERAGGTTDSGIVQANRGWARLERGDAAGAAADLEAGLRRQPGYLEAWRLLGRAREQLGRTAEAAAAYRTYVESGGADPAAREAWERLAGSR